MPKVLAFFHKAADSARQRELVQATEWLARLGRQLKILVPRSAYHCWQTGFHQHGMRPVLTAGLSGLRKVMDIGILEDEGKWLHCDQPVAMDEGGPEGCEPWRGSLSRDPAHPTMPGCSWVHCWGLCCSVATCPLSGCLL